MQIEPPAAHEVDLDAYLTSLYKSGGTAILLRPDAFIGGIPEPLQIKLAKAWREMANTDYDKRSIRMFMRMIFRKRAHIRDNDKEQLYCTEGTILPLVMNMVKPWEPDILKNEKYPAPIHVEHLMRQRRVMFVCGNHELYERIVKA
jgi:hypothetical protein